MPQGTSHWGAMWTIHACRRACVSCPCPRPRRRCACRCLGITCAVDVPQGMSHWGAMWTIHACRRACVSCPCPRPRRRCARLGRRSVVNVSCKHSLALAANSTPQIRFLKNQNILCPIVSQDGSSRSTSNASSYGDTWRCALAALCPRLGTLLAGPALGTVLAGPVYVPL